MDTFATRRARLTLLVQNKANGNLSEFATKFGYSRSQISQFLSESYNDGRSIGERAARTLEERVGVAPRWLDQPLNTLDSLVAKDEGLEPVSSLPAVSSTVGNVPRRDVAVLGTVTPTGLGQIKHVEPPRHGEQGHIEFSSSAEEMYALQVRGGEISPRVKSGEYLIIDASTKPEPGDDVLVKFTDGEWVLYQFMYTRGDEIVFATIKEGQIQNVIPAHDVASISMVAAILNSRMATMFKKS
jgi:SOS-response transcriptional repressor LexA